MIRGFVDIQRVRNSDHDRPDIVTMAKPLANGFPIGAIMVRDEIAHQIGIGEGRGLGLYGVDVGLMDLRDCPHPQVCTERLSGAKP
jgi:hypothetical protein